ncbi:hypothetical protein K8352_18830 [Flavobacteriaceae bacterium F89]|uniref:Uncharacterized protein n=1 Tax=Cerina litoralis TaxID=2874477 RepID=A0AAE3JR52_9FLAO|nr:hypothetical protein [Cerina litoralis]MCG2462826.1 hypothetical protein [Cerina litoralis]
MKRLAIITVAMPLIIVLFGSCQEDINIDTSNPDTNNSDSVFTAKAKRTSMFDGSFDDMLDNSPCTAIQLPVNILLNNNPITINNLSELPIIGESDVVEFSFPVTITNYNYEKVTVTEASQFTKIREDCNLLIENGQGPITCVDIIYPTTVFTATNGNIQNDFSLTNDEELYFFLSNLGSSDRYSVKYPLNITVGQGSVITVNNDSELENLMDSCST